MKNIVYLEVYSSLEVYKETLTLQVPLESFITFCVYKYCGSEQIRLEFIYSPQPLKEDVITMKVSNDANYAAFNDIPWQVSSCLYPVVMFNDTIITGLCAVTKHICKFRFMPQSPHEHQDSLLGFRKGCLQAPNEVSIWTKFCEVDILNTVRQVLTTGSVQEIPINLVRFENHLSKPVRVHNVYKIARDIKKENLKNSKEKRQTENMKDKETGLQKPREPKTRKWKSKLKEELQIDSSTKIEDLDIHHQYAEGPFFTLADLVLIPSYHILIESLGAITFETLLPLTYKWFTHVTQVKEIKPVTEVIENIHVKPLLRDNITVPVTDDVSLYKCDPKRHNPKRRLFTKEQDVENAMTTLLEGMVLNERNDLLQSKVDWSKVPDGANPRAGHLPDTRMIRKSYQLENLLLAVLNLAKDNDLIVDFCSGSGHLGILVAHFLPKCTVILLENKEYSLLRARERVHDMGMKNVFFFQCNLDFYIGKFDIGIALHACGIASDLVLDKCLKANAKFVICPCCYGSLHATDRLTYPRSSKFGHVGIDQYLCIGHAADQTHEDHPLALRGARCMAAIDSDRAHLAAESGYTVTLSRLQPLTCTPKNNLIIGVPS